MAIRCPYCKKRLTSVKAVYGHWAHCEKYHAFVEKNGKEARFPFKWIGYTQRRPKKWISRPVTQKKTVSNPEEKKKEIKKS